MRAVRPTDLRVPRGDGAAWSWLLLAVAVVLVVLTGLAVRWFVYQFGGQ